VTQETEHLARCSFLSLILYLILFNFSFAQDFPDQQVDSLLKSGIMNVVNQEYTEANKYFKQLALEYHELPFGKIYLAASKIAEAYDYKKEYDSDYIESNLQEAREHAEELLSTDEDNLWFNYYYALAEGYIAYYDAIRNDWLSALSTGMNSIRAFGNCINIENNFYEAYIAIGTYEYWMSRKTEFLDWAPFYDDETEIGIEKLRTAIQSASYNSHLAVNSLIWIYIDQKDFNTAIEIGQKAVNEFPRSRYFKWGLARAYEDVNTDSSIQLYYDLLESFWREKDQNRVNEIVLKHIIAQQYVKIGEKDKALILCDEILSVSNLNDYELSKLDERLERVKKFKNTLIQ
jgi:tetratricopeptide (TPR) repeat protein